MKHFMKSTLLCMALTSLAPSVMAQQQKETFEIGDKTFVLNGKPMVIKAAEIHYTRIPAEYWEHRIQMCKALGMNTICIYAFWNIHEQEPGKFDFKGQNDIAQFCKLAQKHGMYIMLRPGPYVCSEWEMGGLPWWLLKKKDIEVRTNDPYFVERTRLFMNEIGKELAPLQITKGGNIIMVQVENEYGAYATDKEYIANIRDIVRNAGFNDVPLFQCDWSSTFQRNGLDDLLWTINFGTGANIEQQFKSLQEARPNTPLMCSEFWSGWFDHWGRKHETRDAGVMVSGLKDMLDRNISFSLYMTHGGTTFGHWGGANSPRYSAMCSSYDYDAPINEAGQTTPKYFKVRELLGGYLDEGQQLADIPAQIPVITIPTFEVTEIAPLFENLPKAHKSETIKPMEDFNQGWGSILYSTTLPNVQEGTTLIINEVHDWAQVFVNGKLLGRLDRRREENTVKLPALPQGAKLDILVEAMGRVNFDRAIHDRKGITESVKLASETTTTDLNNWEVYSFPVNYEFVKNKKFRKGKKVDGPAYYKTTFNVDKPGDVFLDMQTWGKGMVWVNGKSIGRFWEIGPQQTLFMPGCWLKKGKNEIIVLDLKGPKQATIAGLDQPILDQLRQEAPLTNRKDGETLQLSGEQPVYTGSFATGNGWQEVRFDKPIPARYFCLEALNAQDGKDRAAMAELYLLDEQGKPLSRQNWKIAYANSEETWGGNFTADKVFDLQESTYWQTGGKEKYPHQIVVDTNADTKISGFRYLPRAEADAPGMIKDFRIFVKSAPFQY